MGKEREVSYPAIGKVLRIYVIVQLLVIAAVLILWICFVSPDSFENPVVYALSLWAVIAVIVSVGAVIIVKRLKVIFHDRIDTIISGMSDYSEGRYPGGRDANVTDELYYRDSLTGIRNRLAYDHESQMLSKGIDLGDTEFGIAYVSLENLREINDRYGHDKGNLAIKNLSATVCKIFAHAPVYRYENGDFVVVMEKGSYEEAETLIAEFEDTMAKNAHEGGISPWVSVTAAIGYAKYDPGKDKSALDVFDRARSSILQNKK